MMQMMNIIILMMLMSEGGAATITDPTSPTSTVTNLPSGPTVFTWTVSSANGLCTPASANLTITRDAQPTAAKAGPDQSFCEPQLLQWQLMLQQRRNGYMVTPEWNRHNNKS